MGKKSILDKEKISKLKLRIILFVLQGLLFTFIDLFIQVLRTTAFLSYESVQLLTNFPRKIPQSFSQGC